MADFYLVSTELREPYEPRACRILRRLRSKIRDDLALVEVHPPFPRDVYGTTEEVRQLVLASRHKGTSLFPETQLPMAVYVCRLAEKDDPAGDTIASEDLAILDWGEVRQTSV